MNEKDENHSQQQKFDDITNHIKHHEEATNTQWDCFPHLSFSAIPIRPHVGLVVIFYDTRNLYWTSIKIKFSNKEIWLKSATWFSFHGSINKWTTVEAVTASEKWHNKHFMTMKYHNWMFEYVN